MDTSVNVLENVALRKRIVSLREAITTRFKKGFIIGKFRLAIEEAVALAREGGSLGVTGGEDIVHIRFLGTKASMTVTQKDGEVTTTMPSRGHVNILMAATAIRPIPHEQMQVTILLPFPIREGTVELVGIKGNLEIDHEAGQIDLFTFETITSECEILYYPLVTLDGETINTES